MHNSSHIKSRSLELFNENLARQSYPGYPTVRYFAHTDTFEEDPTIPSGPWDTISNDKPTVKEQIQLRNSGLSLDRLGRPLHPWAHDIITTLGGLAGRGFYWRWGPNQTG